MAQAYRNSVLDYFEIEPTLITLITQSYGSADGQQALEGSTESGDGSGSGSSGDSFSGSGNNENEILAPSDSQE